MGNIRYGPIISAIRMFSIDVYYKDKETFPHAHSTAFVQG